MRANQSSKKNLSHAFITFLTSLRPSFVHTLKTAQAQATVRGENRLLIASNACTCPSTTTLAACGECMYMDTETLRKKKQRRHNPETPFFKETAV